jgi:hypothetical protein
VISPNDFVGLDGLSRTLLAFVDRYNQTARPFKWSCAPPRAAALSSCADGNGPEGCLADLIELHAVAVRGPRGAAHASRKRSAHRKPTELLL